MGELRNRRRWLAATLAAVLWLISGSINGAFTRNGFFSNTIDGVMPPTSPGSLFVGASAASITVALVGAFLLTVLHRAFGRIGAAAGSRLATFIISWFAAIAAAAIVGLATDIGNIVSALPPARLQWLLDGLGTQAGIGAYWGLIQGWLPALLLLGATSTASSATSTASSTTAADTVKSAPTGARSRVILASVVVVSMVTIVLVDVAGYRAARIESAEQSAIAEGYDESTGALPDPFAEGEPPATAAPSTGSRDADWCDADQAMLLRGESDAATGHRSLAIRLMNFSDTSCVIEGYIDVAFADQNAHELDVDLERGSSFMATDAGSQLIEVPAGGYAIAHLGWDANSTAGELVARTLFAAPVAGDTRGSWPVELDIVEGSTVSITAWEFTASAG
jgi:hypothetical protein